MALDETNGNLYVTYYNRAATVGDATDVTLARSSDGGTTWQEFGVSESQFTPLASVFFGDYMGIDAHAGRIAMIWTRMDQGTTSVWAMTLADTDLVPSAVRTPVLPASTTLSQNYPNPFARATSIPYVIAREGHARITIVDPLGREVARLVDGRVDVGEHSVAFDAVSLAPGVYHAVMEGEGYRMARQITVVR
jgi:hypothetical protein